jgi:signal transduction histidine kinase
MRERARYLWRYLKQPRSDPAIAAVLATMCLVEMLIDSGGGRPALSVVEVLAFCAPLLVLRTHPVAGTWVAVVLMLVVRRVDGFPDFAGDLVICALAYSCGAHASLREGGLAVAALIVAMQVGMGFSEFPNIEIAFATVGPFWVGYQVRVRSAVVTRLAERTRELHEEHDAFAQLSVRRERARIARELHDIVAHHLAVIVVQAGAGRMAASATSQRTAERFAAIRQSGGQALDEMARLVDLLQADDGRARHLEGRWQTLLAEARSGGLDVRITPPVPELVLPAAIADTAYRIVREGLTNAIKHAPGARVSVRLAMSGEDIEIEVSDDGGTGAAELAQTGAGLGLIGMRERVESSGGTVEAGPDGPRGWRLSASVPVPARAAAATAGAR